MKKSRDKRGLSLPPISASDVLSTIPLTPHAMVEELICNIFEVVKIIYEIMLGENINYFDVFIN